MRTFNLKVGIERIDETPMLCIGLKTTSNKPASEPLRKAVTITAVLILLVLTFKAMDASDAEAHPQQTVNLSSITR
ncbi:MAG: hypothetical protein JSS89_13135 [Bacteroidetes bacterium]|nr:hypothetical protein [Bacteroidota bacterium]